MRNRSINSVSIVVRLGRGEPREGLHHLVQDVLIERLATFLAELSGSYPWHPLPFTPSRWRSFEGDRRSLCVCVLVDDQIQNEAPEGDADPDPRVVLVLHLVSSSLCS